MRAKAGAYSYSITAAVLVLLLTPAGVLAAKLTCLTGTDPSVANDLPQIKVVRAEIDAACPCGSFNGSPGKTHGSYVICAGTVIGVQVNTGNLRTQCKATVKKYYSASTCGWVASKGEAPCIKKAATGRVSCSIKPSAKCPGTPCASFTTCIDAADTNGDGIIGNGDSGACVVAPTATPTRTFAPATPTATAPSAPRFVDNGDGTITDNQTGLMWEKKDQAGGLHELGYYSWAGICDCPTGSCISGVDLECACSGPFCQPDASAAAACAAGTGSAATVGCAQCSDGSSCNVDPFGFGFSTTIWGWLVQLNGSNFAGHSDWRIPTVGQDGGTAELETILAAQYPNCTSSPCVPAAFNTDCAPGCSVTGCSCTATFLYWSATTSALAPQFAWDVFFPTGFVGWLDKGRRGASFGSVRAVR